MFLFSKAGETCKGADDGSFTEKSAAEDIMTAAKGGAIYFIIFFTETAPLFGSIFPVKAVFMLPLDFLGHPKDFANLYKAWYTT